jgi:hypothetical protein
VRVDSQYGIIFTLNIWAQLRTASHELILKTGTAFVTNIFLTKMRAVREMKRYGIFMKTDNGVDNKQGLFLHGMTTVIIL